MTFSRSRALALLAAAPLAACGPRPGSGAIAVGSKNFTESIILGELYAQVLERAGMPVRRRLDLGTTDIAMTAMQRGEIDIYPEYTGTALIDVLHLAPESDAAKAYAAVRGAYLARYDMTWLEASPMNDTQGLATTKAVAAKYGLKTLSDLGAKAASLRLGAVPEFLTRADGLPGLQKRYGGFHFAATRTLDNGLKYNALTHGDVDVVIAFTTEGQLKADDLVVLVDDKHLFPPDQVAPIVRNATLKAKPDIAAALNKLAPLITTDAAQSMNLLVDGPKKAEPADVAKDFLAAHGLA
jgi:osmoprotectant transport system substrate-binding protein